MGILKDVIHEWKAEHFDPDKLLKFYKDNGAKYFMALANHHDNLDLWDSKYQPWNSVNVGPHKDLIGGWARAARKNGFRFAVSVHTTPGGHKRCPVSQRNEAFRCARRVGVLFDFQSSRTNASS